MASRRPSGTRRSAASVRSKVLASKRALQVQTLEKRQLLAAEIIPGTGPQLLSLAVGEDTNFDLRTTPAPDDAVPARNILSEAPSELVFRFAGGTPVSDAQLAAIQIVSAGPDQVFGMPGDPGDDFIVPLGFKGFASDDLDRRVVVTRFSETLADTRYRVLLPGEATQLADPTVAEPPSVDLDLQLGTRIVGVVPQPVDIDSAGQASIRADQVEIYFEGDPLDPAVRTSTQFYKLIDTGDTIQRTTAAASPTFSPTSVNYEFNPSAGIHRATLTFAGDLDTLGVGGARTYRLRVGSADVLPGAPTPFTATETTDPDAVAPITNDSFQTATDIGTTFTAGGGIQSVQINQGEIENRGNYRPPWPGAYDVPGLREQRRDANRSRPIDTTSGINVMPYNFAEIIGRVPGGELAENAITPAQRQRVRDILDLYERHFGVRFVETEDQGLQIATGQIRAIQETVDTSGDPGEPFSLFRLNERDPQRGILILNGNVDWFDGYGLTPRRENPSYFVEALAGIGNLLGIGNLYELPGGIAGVDSPDEPESELFSDDGENLLGPRPAGVAGFPTVTPEPDFLSPAAITIGQSIFRPESDDVDFYRFTVDGDASAGTGRLDVELFAQRSLRPSLLDTSVSLYRVVPQSGGGETFELVSRNDDYFSTDSFLRIDAAGGDYVLAVAASGNDDFDGDLADSGGDGRSEGRYDLRLTYTGPTPVAASLRDIDGTTVDGDSDGTPGGDFNFWFRVTAQIPVAGQPRTYFVTKDVTRGNDNRAGTVDQPLLTLTRATALAQPGDIIRLLPAAGADGEIGPLSDPVTGGVSYDDPSYNIGRGGPALLPLADGETFEVPRGVTVMIDAGALLKFASGKIIAGSDSADEDRSVASLQILGTPIDSVVLTSFEDDSRGLLGDDIPRAPAAGDWGGIELRNDVDTDQGLRVLENDGIFMDAVIGAEILYAGGQFGVREPQLAAIELNENRATILENTIRFSRNAAIAADPNSFAEDTFHAPRFQRGTLSTIDYDRVGPAIAGNTVVQNNVNGLVIRVSTPSATGLEAITVPARFDDTDIVHVITEVLEIQGAPGGAFLLENRPDVASVNLTRATVAGSVPAGTYDYIVTFFNADGAESLASLPTRPVTLTTTGAVRLNNLPTADEFNTDQPLDDNQLDDDSAFTGRNLYRRDADGMYRLVAQLDRNTRSFTDTRAVAGPQTLIGETRPDATGVGVDSRAASTVSYVVELANAQGQPFVADNPVTVQIAGTDRDVVTLTNLPDPEAFGIVDGILNVYRRVGNVQTRIAQLNDGESVLVDDFTNLQADPPPVNTVFDFATIFASAQFGPGSLVRGQAYDYRITFVDSAGGETQSAGTRTVIGARRRDGPADQSADAAAVFRRSDGAERLRRCQSIPGRSDHRAVFPDRAIASRRDGVFGFRPNGLPGRLVARPTFGDGPVGQPNVALAA